MICIFSFRIIVRWTLNQPMKQRNRALKSKRSPEMIHLATTSQRKSVCEHREQDSGVTDHTQIKKVDTHERRKGLI